MKNNTWTIFKKECARFFGDRAMLFTTVIMPGLLIYLMYSFMGENIMKPKDESQSILYVENMSESMRPILEALPLEVVTEGFDAEQLREGLASKDCKYLILVFPEGFDTLMAHYDPSNGMAKPNVQLFYNSASEPFEDSKSYSMVTTVLSEYKKTICDPFEINASVDGTEVYDYGSKEDFMGNILSKILPMVLMIFAFSGCMSIAPPSIAGEKERGTIATLLVTPLKRRELALGKVLSLSLFAMLNGLSSFAGMMLSFPKMIHADEIGLDANIYQMSDYVVLLLLILSTVLILVSVTSIISAKAKSVKSASSAVVPLMIVVSLVGLIPMMSGTNVDGLAYYLIPLYNIVLTMSKIFAHEAQLLPAVITIVSNALYTVFGIWVLTRRFNSEKVMFSK